MQNNIYFWFTTSTISSFLSKYGISVFCVLQFPDAAGYVGFANLPNQVHRKSVKKGFEFTLMVVGEWSLLSF